jgi:hypothetical protein
MHLLTAAVEFLYVKKLRKIQLPATPAKPILEYTAPSRSNRARGHLPHRKAIHSWLRPRGRLIISGRIRAGRNRRMALRRDYQERLLPTAGQTVLGTQDSL